MRPPRLQPRQEQVQWCRDTAQNNGDAQAIIRGLMNMHSFRRAAGVAWFSALVGVISLVGLAGSRERSSDRVYSDAQAARGQQLYKTQCVACHGEALEGVVGPPLGDSGSSRPGVRVRSPSSSTRSRRRCLRRRPGSVSRQQAIDLAAYFLHAGKFPSGQTDLALGRARTDHISRSASVTGLAPPAHRRSPLPATWRS